MFFVPMRAESDAPLALEDFVKNVGIPNVLVSDNAKAEIKGKFKGKTSEFNIHTRSTEPYSPWQNRAEGEIKEFKKMVRRMLFLSHTPRVFWCYCGKLVLRIRGFIARPLFSMQRRTGYELVTGNTPDITEYVEFDWYQPVWYYDQVVQFPEEKRDLGRWLGVAHRAGQAMTYYVVNKNGNVIT